MRAFLDECDDIGGDSAVCVTQEEERNVNVTMKVGGNQRGGSRLQAVAASSFQRVATTWQLLWLWRTLCPASGIDISQLLLLQAKERKGEKEMGECPSKPCNEIEISLQCRERERWMWHVATDPKGCQRKCKLQLLEKRTHETSKQSFVGVACKKAYNICIYRCIYIQWILFIFAAENKKYLNTIWIPRIPPGKLSHLDNPRASTKLASSLVLSTLTRWEILVNR